MTDRIVELKLAGWGTWTLEYRADQRAFQLCENGLHKDWCETAEEGADNLARIAKSHLAQTLALSSQTTT